MADRLVLINSLSNDSVVVFPSCLLNLFPFKSVNVYSALQNNITLRNDNNNMPFSCHINSEYYRSLNCRDGFPSIFSVLASHLLPTRRYFTIAQYIACKWPYFTATKNEILLTERKYNNNNDKTAGNGSSVSFKEQRKDWCVTYESQCNDVMRQIIVMQRCCMIKINQKHSLYCIWQVIQMYPY